MNRVMTLRWRNGRWLITIAILDTRMFSKIKLVKSLNENNKFAVFVFSDDSSQADVQQ